MGALKRTGILVLAWTPFFAIWVLIATTYGQMSILSAVVSSLISMGMAALLGIPVWHVCRRWPWPLHLAISFYIFQIGMASAYALVWNLAVWLLESLHRGALLTDFWSSRVIGFQLLTGVWIYGLFAGVSYAIQTRNRL